MSASDTTTGTEVLRQAMAGRNKKLNLANWARDLGIANETLHSFIAGSDNLSAEVKTELARRLFGDSASFNAETDRLVRAKTEAVSIGPGPVWSLGDNPYPPRHVPRPSPTEGAPKPRKASAPAVKAVQPGWAAD
jgi:hypothetical protein